MKKSTRQGAKKLLIPILVAALLLGAILWAGNSTERVRAQDATNTPTPAAQLEDLLPLVDDLNPPKYPNIDSNLNQIVEQAESGQFTAQAAAANAPFHDATSVAVTINLTEGYADAIAAYLKDNGVDPRNIGSDYIEVYVPVELLPDVSEQEGVVSIRTIIPRQSSQSTVVSEGVAAHAVPAWHTAGYKGSGVKIGIIDDFQGFSALMGTELPSAVQARCYTSVGVFTSNRSACETVDNHGTAVTEIVFDIAPDATYYISNAFSLGDLQSTVNWMVEQGVDVINLSSTYPWLGRGDGTSRYSYSSLRTVDTAVSNGIVFVNSAGNEASSTWFGGTSRMPFDARYDFRFQYFNGNDFNNCVSLNAGEVLAVQLRWDDTWNGANRDLDLILFHGFTIVDFSDDLQFGLSSHIPFEYLRYSAQTSGIYCIVISHENRNPSVPSWIQLQAFSSQRLEHHTLHHSIGSPAESANPGLLAVGAASWNSTNAIRPFSSRGPAPDGRVKPDIVGADSVRTISHGAIAFGGTSASTPHVAGMAALVKLLLPGYSPSQIATYLKNNAQPRGAKPNNTWGHGFARLPVPQAATATPPPTSTPTSIPTAVPTVPATPIPTATPSPETTTIPTAQPTVASTVEPTETPTSVPTVAPTPSPPPPTRIPVPTATPDTAAIEELENRVSVLEGLVETLKGMIATLTSRVSVLELNSTPEPTPTPTPVTPIPTPIPTSTPAPGITPEPTVEPTSTPTPVVDACLTVITNDGEYSGSWDSACPSTNRPLDSSRPDDGNYYARYYSFTLSESSDVIISLNSTDADTFLYLLEGAGRDGTVAHFNDDIERGNTNSQISQTLEAGDYTVEATTYGSGITGSFTFSVSGVQ